MQKSLEQLKQETIQYLMSVKDVLAPSRYKLLSARDTLLKYIHLIEISNDEEAFNKLKNIVENPPSIDDIISQKDNIGELKLGKSWRDSITFIQTLTTMQIEALETKFSLEYCPASFPGFCRFLLQREHTLRQTNTQKR